MRYTRPFPWTERPSRLSEKDDIFALGTVLYEMSVGHRLYHEKSDSEVYELLRNHEFPDLSGLAAPLCTVIERCWKDQYNSADKVIYDLGEYACRTDGSPSAFADYKSPDDPSACQALLQFLGLSLSVLLVLAAIRQRENLK